MHMYVCIYVCTYVYVHVDNEDILTPTYVRILLCAYVASLVYSQSRIHSHLKYHYMRTLTPEVPLVCVCTVHAYTHT